jgi:hypothetical protein
MKEKPDHTPAANNPSGALASLLEKVPVHAVYAATASIGLTSSASAYKFAAHKSWDDALLLPLGVVALMNFLQVLHVLYELARRRARGRTWSRQTGALLLLAAYMALTAAGEAVILTDKGHWSPPYGLPEITTAVYLVVWYPALWYLGCVKSHLQVRRFFEAGTPGRWFARHVIAGMHLPTNGECLMGPAHPPPNSRHPVLPLPIVVLLVSLALLAAASAQRLINNGKHIELQPKLSTVQQVNHLPITFPGMANPLVPGCIDRRAIEGILGHGPSRQLATQMLTAIDSLGIGNTGCPQSLPYPVGKLWVVPLTSPEPTPRPLSPAVVIGNTASGNAVTVHEQMTPLVWHALASGRVADVYPQLAIRVGVWQLLTYTDGTCDLLRTRYHADTIEIPASVLALAAQLADPLNALMTFDRSGTAGYKVAFYSLTDTRHLPLTVVHIDYDGVRASYGKVALADSTPCTSSDIDLIARARQASS